MVASLRSGGLKPSVYVDEEDSPSHELSPSEEDDDSDSCGGEEREDEDDEDGNSLGLGHPSAASGPIRFLQVFGEHFEQGVEGDPRPYEDLKSKPGRGCLTASPQNKRKSRGCAAEEEEQVSTDYGCEPVTNFFLFS